MIYSIDFDCLKYRKICKIISNILEIIYIRIKIKKFTYKVNRYKNSKEDKTEKIKVSKR
jgi:hypothetical protein